MRSRSFLNALPFWVSMCLPVLVGISAVYGGWTIVIVPVVTWYVIGGVDLAVGRDTTNLDPNDATLRLFWHRAVTLVWPLVQFLTLFGLLAYVVPAEHLNSFEKIVIFMGAGVMTGTIGINYAHELMHQKDPAERFLADFLLAMVLYSHFRSEHLLGHHRYVGTPRDPVTARYNENFYRFYPRVLKQSLLSAFDAEAEMLRRKGLGWTDISNPFWLYGLLQRLMLLLAIAIGGWSGLGLFLVQAGIAIWHLELINYIEHYGLTRKHLGDGRYEHTRPHHSWNTDYRVSNWMLINLQRHSDHHYKPDRRYPLLQTYSASQAPQLPYSYAVMGVLAMMPTLWRRVMNPRVRRWRAMFYPEITDWHAYNKALNPLPR